MSQSLDNGQGCVNYTATFFPRLAAYIVDMIIVGILVSIVIGPLSIMIALFPDFILFQNVFFCYTIADVFAFILVKAYFILLTGITGTTIGKRLFHLYVVDREGGKVKFSQLFFREIIGRFLSTPLVWGYIMCFIDKEHRAFHDYVSDTSVICAQYMKIMKKEPKKKKEVKETAAPAVEVVKEVVVSDGAPIEEQTEQPKEEAVQTEVLTNENL